MFRIYIDNTRAMPVSSTQMEILVTNGYFKEKPTKNDLIYDTAFEATPELRIALGHAQNRQVKITRKRYPCTVVMGTKSYSGTFFLKKFESEAYVGHIYINEFNIDSYSKKLTEFSRPLTGTLISQWENAVNNQWPATPYYMPTLINHAFYDDLDTVEEDKTRPDYTGIVNPYMVGPQFNIIGPGLNAINYYTACPQPCLLELLKIGFEDAGFSIKGDLVKDPDVQKMWLYNNKCLDIIPERDPNLITTASNETNYTYNLKGPEAKLNFTDSTGPSFNLATDQFKFVKVGKHRVSLSVGYRNATTPIKDLKIKAFKTNISDTGNTSNSVIQYGSSSATRLGELQCNWDFMVHANDINTNLYFTLNDPQVHNSSDPAYATSTIEIIYIRFQIECLPDQIPYYDAFGKRSGFQNFVVKASSTNPNFFDFKIERYGSFNLANDTLTAPSTGLAKITLEVDYLNAQQQPFDMGIMAWKNGAQWKRWPEVNNGTNNANGTIIFEVTEPVFSGQQFQFTFHDRASNPDYDVNISEMRGSIEYLDGELKRIDWKAPTDLAEYVPDVKFGDLVDAILQTGVVKMTVDPLTSSITLDYKEGISSLSRKFDLQNKPFVFKNNEIQGMDEDTIIKYAINDGKDNTLSEEYSKIFLYENFEWSLVDKVPNNFSGTIIDLQLLPLVQRQAYIGVIQDNLDFKDVNFSTIINNTSGYIEGSQSTGTSLNQLQFGMYDGIKYAESPDPAHNPMATAPAHFSTLTKTLKLELNNPSSLLHRQLDWVQFLETRSRKETYTFDHLQRLPQSDEAIIFKNQSLIWEQARILYTPNRPVSVELLIR